MITLVTLTNITSGNELDNITLHFWPEKICLSSTEVPTIPECPPMGEALISLPEPTKSMPLYRRMPCL